MSNKLSNPQKALQKYRGSLNNVYILVIRNFTDLSELEQEIIFQRMYRIYITSFRGPTYEQFKKNLLSRKGSSKNAVLFIEKTFNTDIGFGFNVYDVFYYKENDFSKENTYVSSLNIAAMMPHFVGSNIMYSMYAMCQQYVFNNYPGINVVGLTRVLNPLVYDMMCSLGCIIYPSPDEPISSELDKLLKKMMKIYDSEGSTVEKPFVISRPIRLIGDDIELYQKMYPNASKYFRYYVDQTELIPDNLLVAVSVERMVEGNTLGLNTDLSMAPGEVAYEMRFYDPVLNSFSKL